MPVRALAAAVLPATLVASVRRKRFRTARPPVGWVRFGSLRRTTPVSTAFGLDRGAAIDRRYIARFLDDHRGDIRGRVLEVGDARYTTAFGDDRVTRSDVLHAIAGNPAATIVGDLGSGAGIADASFDCVILTQVLQYVPNVDGAIAQVRRMLAPGGVALVVLPALARIDRGHAGDWDDWWRWTERSAREQFARVFGDAQVEVRAYGNVLAACSFLMGLAQEDLRPEDIDACDPDYPIVITVRATRPLQA